MKKLILHIPHSSDKIPDRNGYLVDNDILENEILKLTDWYTDDLFSFEKGIVVKANFSRIFCDVERFSDDKQEIMAQFGMGVLYKKTDNGLDLRDINPELREYILNRFYWPHHRVLNQEVDKQLNSNGKAIIVDCHSFPNIPLNRSIDKTFPRPDFNIGTDSFHTPDYLTKISKDFFEQKDYSVGIDWPYSGTIVPMNHYHKTKNVESIMLEVNRNLYLNGQGNEKSSSYPIIKNIIREYLETINGVN